VPTRAPIGSGASSFPFGVHGCYHRRPTEREVWVIFIDIREPFFTLWPSFRPLWQETRREGRGMEYVLIVSFALIIGFVLGLLTTTILGVSSRDETLRREPVRVQSASTLRR
jgi:hypothetical protein